MKNNFTCWCLAVAAICMFLIVPVRAAAQQEPASQQVPQRPHLDDPNYYDRDASTDKPVSDKFKEETKAKADARMKDALAKPTPHTADGHPDLNGIWVAPGGLAVIISPDGKDRKVLFGPFPNGKPAPVVPPMPPNQPKYKSELQAKVQALWIDQTHKDPTAYKCGEPGVPRMGVPNQIVQTPGQVVLLYQQGRAGGIPGNTFRVIPMDGRPHRTDVDPSPIGDSIGHWEGDTLVIDVTRLDDSTWLSQYGTFHSDAMHVIERLKRKGDTLEYTATVEDPAVLTEPWTTTPVTRFLGGTDDALVDDVPCVDNDSAHLAGLERN
jgi:hypothetical protein